MNTLITASLLLAGCSAAVQQQINAPMLRAAPSVPVDFKNNIAQFNLGDGKVLVYPVVLSEKTKMLLGPALVAPAVGAKPDTMKGALEIKVWLTAKRDAAIMTVGAARLVLLERNEALAPRAIQRTYCCGPRGKDGLVSYVTDTLKTDTLIVQKGEWNAITFSFDHPLQTTEEYALQLGPVYLSGRKTEFPLIYFTRTTRAWMR